MRRRAIERGEAVWISLATVPIAALLYSHWLSILRPLSHYPTSGDTRFFAVSGILMTEGYLPYADYWDIKPPAIHEFYAVIALLVGGDPVRVIVVGSFVVVTLVVLTSVFVALAIREVTSVRSAALAGMLAPFVLWQWYLLPMWKVHPHWIIAFLTALTLYLLLSHRLRWAVAIGTLAAAFWQPALGLAATAVLATWRVGRLREGLLVAGATTLLVLSPWLLRDPATVGTMLVQTILAPVITENQNTVAERLGSLGSYYGLGGFVLALGLVGAYAEVRAWVDRRDGSLRWVVPLVILWFGGFFTFVTLDTPNYTMALLVACSVGTGVLVGALPPKSSAMQVSPRLLVLGLVVGLVVLELAWIQQWPLAGGKPAVEAFSLLETATAGADPPCHLRMSYQEKRWIRAIPEVTPERGCSGVDPLTVIERILG